MNARTLIVGALAVVCGLSAMFLVQAIRKPASGPVVEKASVVFATTEVKPGETIQESMIEIREIPKSEVPDDAILTLADAIDRASLTQLDKGDLLREKKLAERGAGRGMAALIKTGMRAITIPTPSVSTSMAGFLLPGNRVDILLTTNSSGGVGDESGGATTLTLLQNVEILAVHTTVNAPTTNKIDPDQARSVTVQVTPLDANRLQLAQTKGTLHLSLRNLKDSLNAPDRPVTLADIQLMAPKPAPPLIVHEPPKVAPIQKPETRDLALAIRQGMRAFTITTPSHSSSMVATIRPGHRVDVLLTTDPKSAEGMSMTLLQDQEVLDTHPTLDPSMKTSGSPDEVRAITLLVTPRDAELLDLAENSGSLHVALRPENSEEGGPKPDPVTAADLRGDRRPAEPGFRTRTLQVRTLRGTAVGANTMTHVLPVAPRNQDVPSPPLPGTIPTRIMDPNLTRSVPPRTRLSGLSDNARDRTSAP